ncbi:MAG: hypothetical protein QOD99_510 [Chthoniobacter sp.]|jgi:hypothetical protein|nr:hypothetical protein [Chthoniobacter sp.]
MKTTFALFLLLSVSLRSAHARENPYDVFGKVLAPFVGLLAKESESPNRALSLDARLVEATPSPAGLAGSTVHLDLESPDKLRLRAPVLGEEVTICRNGQQLWAAPGAKIEALINRVDLPKPKKKYKLADFELPIPEQQLVFLPVLFQVADAGDETVGGATCRVLDVHLMPELARSLDVENWSLRVWVTPNYRLAKLQVKTPQWSGLFEFNRIAFSPTLTAETWIPGPEQTDVVKLTPERFKQLLDAAFGAKERKSGPKTKKPKPPEDFSLTR